eukprot:m.39902 g.39902  ORF g.39902 m.39902 type:complete len:305 (-) comp5968_c0_seq4:847-1761(-)
MHRSHSTSSLPMWAGLGEPGSYVPRLGGARVTWVSHRKAAPVFLRLGLLLLVLGLIGAALFWTEAMPLQQSYAVVVDAGSSGSRVFMYHWPCRVGSRRELPRIQQLRDMTGQPAVLKIEPGLSHYAATPEAAVRGIVELLRFAENAIPAVAHATTEVHVLATAGLRMVSESAGDAILAALQEQLPMQTTLRVQPRNIKVISGKMEGVYGWLAANYMLDRFGPDSPGTVGCLDMGGGSAQIAYEVDEHAEFPYAVAVLRFVALLPAHVFSQGGAVAPGRAQLWQGPVRVSTVRRHVSGLRRESSP